MLNVKRFSVILLLVCACSQPHPVYNSQNIDVSQPPVQADHMSVPFQMQQGSFECTVTPKAKYRVSAIVVSKADYWYDDWRAKVAPFDLALAWGDLIKPENDKYVTYSQFGRWYYYHWRAGTPFGEDFIVRNSSNNHIIPANKNILAAVRILRKRKPVMLEGYLVDIDGKQKDRSFWWHTSLSRDDKGDGSCEIFYVTRIVFDGKDYQ